MDIKVLIGMLGRPWLMEPGAAQHWSGIVQKFISSGSAPLFDSRYLNEGYYYGTGPVFKINEDGAVDKKGSIQVFRMYDPIGKYDYCGAPGSQTWIQHLGAANADPAVSSILLWVDSPGGQADGTESLANAVRSSRKPVIAFTDGMMASAAYWIGSSASLVIADGSNKGWNAIIGSIGTMCIYYDDRGALEKEGYKRHLIFADDSSDKWGDYFKIIEGDYSEAKKGLNGMNDTFHSAVKMNRVGKLSKEENVLTGKVYNAKEALKYGLIDKIGDFSTAVKAAAEAGRQYKKFNRTKSDKMQKVLIAANAEAFQIVEGGAQSENTFIVTESHLNAVDAKLAQDETIIRNLTKTNNDLQAKVEAATIAEGLQQQLEAANAKVTELEAANVQLTQQLEDAKEGAKSFFGEKGKEQDKAAAHETDAEAEPEYMKEARAMLPPVAKK